MSYVALITDAFEAVTAFYGDILGATTIDEWERPVGRGRRIKLHGLIVEILDNRRQRSPRQLGAQSGRAHLVLEVADIAEARLGLAIASPEPTVASWGAAMFELRDPDDTPITYLQWLEPRP